jgi:SAM-dependent methyltransferase
MFSRFATAVSSLLGSKKKPARAGDGPLDAMIPDFSIAGYVGGDGPEQFKTVGLLMVDWFKDYGELKPEEDILEVGCGIGRIAIPLTQYVTSGTYVGFDIVRHGIEWCQQKVTPRYPNFTFFVADIHNNVYNPRGRYAASEYTFPFPDGSFDFVYLTSVFTHMLPSDLERYAAEIGRVLRPGGRCFCTAYIISAEARTNMDQGTSHRTFQPQGGYWTDTPGNPEAAVAYPEEYLEDVFQRSSLEITRVIPGEWWKNEFAQDILVARKVD